MAPVPVFVDLIARPDGLHASWPSHAPADRPLDIAAVTLLTSALNDLRDAERRHAPDFPGRRAQVGRALFDLLDGPTRTLANLLARQQQTGTRLDLVVRLRIAAAAGTAPAAPHPATGWRFELLDEGAGPIACRPGVTLTVQLGERANHGAAVLPEGRLRVLFLAASPKGVQPVLDYEREEEALLRALADAIGRREALVHVVEEGSLAELVRRLQAEEYDVVYLSCHGELRHDGPRLLLEDDEGNLDVVDPERLFAALQRGRALPALLLLAACETADGRADTASMAAAMVARGLPSVAAWIRPVRDDDATACAKDLLERLGLGAPLAEAVAFARRELQAADAHRVAANEAPSHAWATFHLVGADGAGCRLDRTRPVPTAENAAPQETYRFLGDSRMRVLENGFVGRRRPLQRLLRVLRTGREGDRLRAGALLVGTRGVGKSCLAGRALSRYLQEATGAGMVVVHGVLDEPRLFEALRQQALRWDDRDAEAMLKNGAEEFAARVERLFRGRWAKRPLVVVLDDFEQNLELREHGVARVAPAAAPLLAVLLHACRQGRPKVIVTATATFEVPADLADSLAEVPLGPFDAADVRKLWTRGSDAELRHLSAGLWETLCERLGRNARVLDWARTLFAGKSNAELQEVVAKANVALPDWRGSMPDEKEQARLAALFLLHMALDAAKAQVSADALELVRRARVYEVPVPEAAFAGLAEGLALDLASDLPALANFGLLERGPWRDGPGYRVSPLVEPEFAAADPVRWHRVAAAFWESVARTDHGWRAADIVAAWEHALAAGAENVADRLSHLLDGHLHNQGLYRGNAELACRQLARFPDDFRANWWAGDSMRLAGDLQMASRCFSRALASVGTRSDEREVAAFLHSHAGFLAARGDLQGARHNLQRSLDITRKALGTEDHPEVAASLHELGYVLKGQGDLQGARNNLKRSLDIKRRILGTEDHPSVAASLHALAGVLRAQGDLQGARNNLQRSLDIKRKVFGTEDHPEVAASLHELASVLSAQGNLQDARDNLKRSLDIDLRVLGTENHPSVAASLHELAGVLKAQGDLQGARDNLERSLDIKRSVLGTEDHPAVAASLHELAGVLMEQGDLQGARNNLQRSLDIKRKVLGTEDHPDVAASLHGLAVLAAAEGRLEDAIHGYRQVLAIEAKVYGTRDHYVSAETEWALGMLLLRQARHDEAKELLGHAVAVLQRFAPEHPILQLLRRAHETTNEPATEPPAP